MMNKCNKSSLVEGDIWQTVRIELLQVSMSECAGLIQLDGNRSDRSAIKAGYGKSVFWIGLYSET